MRPHEVSELGERERDQLRQLFDAYDFDRRGALTSSQLRLALAGLGIPLSAQECVALVDEHDKTGDGSLGYEQFLSVVPRPEAGHPLLAGLPQEQHVTVWVRWHKSLVPVRMEARRTVRELCHEVGARLVVARCMHGVLSRHTAWRVAEYLNASPSTRELCVEAATYDALGVEVGDDPVNKRVVVRRVRPRPLDSVYCRMPAGELEAAPAFDPDGWDSDDGADCGGRLVTVFFEDFQAGGACGVRVKRVARHSAAYKDGVRRGWRLRSADGLPVARARELAGSGGPRGLQPVRLHVAPPPPALQEGMGILAVGGDKVLCAADVQELFDKGRGVRGVTVQVATEADRCVREVSGAKAKPKGQLVDCLVPSELRLRPAELAGGRPQGHYSTAQSLHSQGIGEGAVLQSYWASHNAKVAGDNQENFRFVHAKGDMALWARVKDTVERKLRAGAESLTTERPDEDRTRKRKSAGPPPRELNTNWTKFVADIGGRRAQGGPEEGRPLHFCDLRRAGPPRLQDWDWVNQEEKIKAVYRLETVTQGDKGGSRLSTWWLVFHYRVAPWQDLARTKSGKTSGGGYTPKTGS